MLVALHAKLTRNPLRSEPITPKGSITISPNSSNIITPKDSNSFNPKCSNAQRNLHVQQISRTIPKTLLIILILILIDELSIVQSRRTTVVVNHLINKLFYKTRRTCSWSMTGPWTGVSPSKQQMRLVRAPLSHGPAVSLRTRWRALLPSTRIPTPAGRQRDKAV